MPRKAKPADWSRLMTDASLLWADAGTVIAMRSWQMMIGAASAKEMAQMVGEKMSAGLELAGVLSDGKMRSPHAAAATALGIYGRHVRGNRRRLGRR